MTNNNNSATSSALTDEELRRVQSEASANAGALIDTFRELVDRQNIFAQRIERLESIHFLRKDEGEEGRAAATPTTK